MVVGKTRVLLETGNIVGSPETSGLARVDLARTGGVFRVVGTQQRAAFDSLVRHEINQLQGAFFALHVRDVDCQVVGRIELLEERGFGRVVVRDVVRKDDLHFFVFVHNGNSEGRTHVRDAFFPGERQGAWFQDAYTVHPVH